MDQGDKRFMKTGIIALLVIGCAVAAFGLTFHFFGQSEIVPAPSKEFGFLALAPLGVIDRIYEAISGERLYWYPVPMFFCLWLSYSLLTVTAALLILKKRE